MSRTYPHLPWFTSHRRQRSERHEVTQAKHAVIQPRPYQILGWESELYDAAEDLEARRAEAIEWARERGVTLLKDVFEEKSQ